LTELSLHPLVPAEVGRTITAMYVGDVGGDTPVAIGVALVAVGVLVGKKYGASAEKKFNRILNRALLASLAVVVVIVLIYWAIA
jgi:Na+-driven multidrug efflux pump